MINDIRNRTRAATRRLAWAALIGTALALVAFSGGRPVGAAPPRAPCPPNWQIVAGPALSDGYGWLYDVSAATPNDIWAAGDFNPARGHTQPLLEHWNGSAWAIVPAPTLPDRDVTLRGVAARTATDAWAVGMSGLDTVIEHWNGRAWTLVPSPNVPQAGSILNAVTAASANDAWAAGGVSKGNGTPVETLILHWNGRQWSRVASPNVQWISSQLMSISARSSSDAWAVGYGGVAPLAMHWDGRRWTMINGALPGGASAGAFDSVVSITANDVWAVGGQSGSTGATALIEHWNGRRWTIATLPEAGLPPLASVAATAANDVWALTDYIAPNGAEQSLLLHWDGRRWTRLANLAGGGVQYVAAKRGAIWGVGVQNYGKILTARWGPYCLP
jgi:hypothetical protein